MTPQQQPQQPVQPAALPLVALILTILGFCFPPIFLVGIILAIVSLAKSSEPAYAARKTLAVISLVMIVAIVPVMGILAAIAIPNFIRFQARSKQADAKINLKSAYVAQKSYFGEKETYGTKASDIGFSPDRSRYLFLVGEDELPPTAPGAQTRGLRETVPMELMEALDVEGDCPDDCNITMVAAGNIDNDSTIDVWSVSTKDRVIKVAQVSAGTPFNPVNDVSE